MTQHLTFLEEDVTSRLKTLQSNLRRELASLAVTCIKSRIKREKENTLAFNHFLLECITKQYVSMELKERYRPTQSEIEVAKIAITLYQIEIKVGGEIKGKFFKNFLYECMVMEDVSPEICEMYGLRYNEK